MRNQFAGACGDCGAWVPAGAGFFSRRPASAAIALGARWKVRCMACVVFGKVKRGDSLSNAQRAWLDKNPRPEKREVAS